MYQQDEEIAVRFARAEVHDDTNKYGHASHVVEISINLHIEFPWDSPRPSPKFAVKLPSFQCVVELEMTESTP